MGYATHINGDQTYGEPEHSDIMDRTCPLLNDNK